MVAVAPGRMLHIEQIAGCLCRSSQCRWYNGIKPGLPEFAGEDFMKDLKQRNPDFDKPLYIFEQQQSQSEEQLIADAIRKTFKGLVEINKLERKPHHSINYVLA